MEEVGQLRRAWFTTFNLDIHFFERFVFPLLVGKDHAQLQTQLDYETLSQSLDYESEQPEPGRIEVRVFYDFRKLEQSAQVKLTTVRLHPVNVADLRNAEGKKAFTGGVFHPKVALLENQDGALWLMSGSANLTLSGWSRNCECLSFEPLADAINVRRVGAFFHELFRRTNKSRLADQHPLLDRLLNGRGFKASHDGKLRDWVFLSSFNGEAVLDRLTADGHSALTVWSPYFEGDLGSLVDQFPEDLDEINLVPAPNREGRIGISDKAHKGVQKSERIRLLEDVKRSPEQFTHAKIWFCGNKLAIGSWNCTEAGLNLSNKSKNNVEAGMIHILSTREKNALSEDYRLRILKTPHLSSEAELEQDKEGLLEDFAFAVALEINWTSLTVSVADPESADALQANVKSTDILILPGLGKCDPMKLMEGISVRSHASHFLTDRSYSFESAEGKTLYRGYLQESGLDERPVQRFKDLDDYLSGWIKGKPEDQTFRHQLNYAPIVDAGDDLADQTKAILSSESRNTWFTAFFAFDQIAYRILQVKKNLKTKNERQQAFILLGRTLPGNLNELRGHLQTLLDLFHTEREQFRKSPVYLWFLVEKANAVFDLFNTESQLDEERIPALRNLSLESLLPEATASEEAAASLKKWKRLVTTKLNDWAWSE